MIATFSGLLAGLVHVFSGPDHLAAVAPLAAENRRRSWSTGLRWGLGHSAGVILVGLLSLALREVLPMDRMSAWSERLVGVVLIGIGLWGLRKAYQNRVHTHEHAHDGSQHVHIHVHSEATRHGPGKNGARGHGHVHAAFAVGTLHGLAGSSHFFGVLAALAFPSRFDAVTYLAAYGVGTVVAMISFSSIIGWLGRLLAPTGAGAYRVLMSACSIAALGVGCWWLLA